MQVSDLFSQDRVALGCRLSGKDEALSELSALLAGDPGPSTEEIVMALAERERLASTGVGSGVAIPHGRVAGLEGVRVAVMTCPAGVEFASVDGELVHILVGILAPQRRPSDHLKVLARVSRLLREESTRGELMRAQDPAQLVALLTAAAD